MIDFDAHPDLFAELERHPEVQAALALADDLAAMHGIIAGHLPAALSAFEALTTELADRWGTGSELVGWLATALSATPRDGVFIRYEPRTERWVWAASRDAEPDAWQPLATEPVETHTTGEPEGASLPDIARAVYSFVLEQLEDPAHEEHEAIWAHVCAEIETRLPTWHEGSAETVARIVRGRYLRARAEEEAALTEAIQELTSALTALGADLGSRPGHRE